jgi:hypothetical protein
MSDFRTQPTAQGMDEASFMLGASTQQLGIGGAIAESFKEGALKSFGLGTAIRELSLPAPAPASPEGEFFEGPRLIDPLAPLDDTAQPFRLPRGPFVATETPEAFQERRRAAGALTKEEYEASASFRASIPYDPRMTAARAAVQASWYDASQYRNVLRDRTDTVAVQTVAELLGQATDPINFIPVLGPGARALATARLGVIGGRAAAASADAVINTAAASVFSAPFRTQFGDDVSYRAMLLEIGGAAVIGAAFGGVTGVFAKRALDRQSIAIRNAQDVQRALDEAVGSLAMDGQVRMTEPALDALDRVRVGEERGALVQLDGNLRSSTAVGRFLPDDAELDLPQSFDQFLASHAETDARAARPDIFGRLDKTTARLDAVDAQIRHVEERLTGGSDYDAVTAVDPESAARLRAIDEELAGGIPTRRRQDLEREREIVAATTNEALPAGGRTAIDDATARPLREELDHLQAERARLDEFRQQHADRAMREVERAAGANEARAKRSLFIPPEPPRPADAIAAERRVDADMQPEQAQVAATEGPSPLAKELAEEFRVDPKTGDFPEMVDFDRLIDTERLTASEKRAFDEATAVLERAQAYGDGLRAAAVCMMV